MHKLFKNWRNILKEQGNEFPYQIYCDMDGVLVDFVKGAVDAINDQLEQKSEEGKPFKRLVIDLEASGRHTVEPEDISIESSKRMLTARKYMYDLLSANTKFWSELPWMENGQKLWGYIGQYNPYILTAPMQKESETGKVLWIEKNLNPPPKKVYMHHDKYKWARNDDGSPNLLIDDFKRNIIPWKEAGGIAIYHTDIDKTIKHLEDIRKNGKIP